MRASNVAASGSKMVGVSAMSWLVGSDSGGGFRTVFGAIASSRSGLSGVLFWSFFSADFAASILWFTFKPTQKIMDSAVRKLKVEVAKSDDLILKAAKALQKESGISAGAALQLIKSVPLGAGLGGGSADAAACLRLLNSFWKLDWSLDALMTLGAHIGSDVPACVMNAPCRMTGRGEHVTKIDTLPILFCVS